MSAVMQHDFGNIGCRRGTENRASKSRLIKSGEVSAVIGVSVRQDHSIQILRIAAKLFVLTTRFGPVSLEQPAVKQDPQVFGFDQMLTSGDFTSCTEERDFHRCLSSFC